MAFAVIGASFFSCNKDEDSYYPFDDEREQSIDQNDTHIDGSED